MYKRVKWKGWILIRLVLFKFFGAAQEAGQLKQIGEEAGIVTQGEYSYTAPGQFTDCYLLFVITQT